MTDKVEVTTFTATIYVGSKVRKTGDILDLNVGLQWIQEYVDRVGLCVTVTKTEYLYTNGGEPGLIVGLINYPRFPSTSEKIRAAALEIAAGLKEVFEQLVVTVVFPDQTTMLRSEPEQDVKDTLQVE